MKLSISNIAWADKQDALIYEYLSEVGFSGVEIAPTRIFPQKPYTQLSSAKYFAQNLKIKYGLTISSIQSIWFGKSQAMFGSAEERKDLFEYTKAAIDFAVAMDCGNLVFGCPKNRNIKSQEQYSLAVDFFSALGQYASDRGTVLALEANPEIYQTNFITKTEEAFSLVREVNSPGFLVNLDLGTILYNKENIMDFSNQLEYVNHIHISEPYLAPIVMGKVHLDLVHLLRSKKYCQYVSIEMKKIDDLVDLKARVEAVSELFRHD